MDSNFEEILKKALTIPTVKKEVKTRSYFYIDNSSDDLILSFLYRMLVINSTSSFAENFDFESCFGTNGIPFRWSHIFSEIRSDFIQSKIEDYLPISFWPIRKNLLPFVRCENVGRILEASIDALSESIERERNKNNDDDSDYNSEIDDFDSSVFQSINVQTSSLSQNKTPMPFYPSGIIRNISSHTVEQSTLNSNLGRRNQQIVSSLLFDDLVLCVDSVSPIATKTSNTSLKLIFRSNRGDKIHYTVSTEASIETNLSLFSALISRLFDCFVDTRRRGMKTAGYQSFFIRTTNGSTGFVTRMDSIPLPRLPSVSNKRWCSYQHRKIIEMLPASRFICTAEFVNWCSIFAYRHAALSSLQLLLGAKIIDIGEMSIDHKFALPSVSIMSLIDDKSEPFVRLNALFRHYIDDVMRFGPFKSGLVSSFLCMGYKRDKLRIYLMNILVKDQKNLTEKNMGDCRFSSKEADDRINEISTLSIAESNLDEVNEKIVNLIKCSTEYRDQYDEVFNFEYEQYNSTIFM